MGLLIAGAIASSALLGAPLAPTVNRAPAVRMAVNTAAADDARPSTRRDLLSTVALAALGGALANAAPDSASASYALYQSSYDSFQDRKTSGYVPVATNDRESLAEIQKGITVKRPMSRNKPQKAPQYCAGQTSAVTPMLENRCQIIGVSKADQSNAQADAFGNMNVGAYTSMSGAERAALDARMLRVEQAADYARLRQLANKQH